MTLMFPKPVEFRDRAWIKALREYPCVITGDYRNDYMDIVPAHLSFSGRGMARKADDNHVLPIRADLHQLQHGMSEIRWWRTNLTDNLLEDALIALAEKLYQEWRNQ